MNERAAIKLANAVHGQTWQSGGGLWLVILRRRDAALVVWSGDAVCEYTDENAFDRSEAARMIPLA